MTDAIQTALIAGLPPTILAAAALIAAIRNSRKADKLIVKADEIHEVTNSAKSAVDEKLEVANKHIAELTRMVDKLINGKRRKAP